jgi:hypothetical protein
MTSDRAAEMLQTGLRLMLDFLGLMRTTDFATR